MSTVFLLALSVSVVLCAQVGAVPSCSWFAGARRQHPRCSAPPQLLHSHKTFLESLINWELLVWASSLLFFLLRLSTLGSKIDCKYSNSSVLLAEQVAPVEPAALLITSQLCSGLNLPALADQRVP